MATLSGIIFLCLLFALVAFWQSNARARELANQIAEQVCKREELQLLDGTTLLNRIRIKRNSEGKLRLVRYFQFEFYDGSERLTGKMTMTEQKLIDLYIEKSLPEPSIKPAHLFQSANEVSNIIPFPGSKKEKSPGE